LEDSLACELAKDVVGGCQKDSNGEMCAESFCTTGSWTAWKKKEVQKENKDNHPRPSFSDFWDESDIKRFFNRNGQGVVTWAGNPNFAWGKKTTAGIEFITGTSLSGGQVSTAFDHDPRLRCCAMLSLLYKGNCLCKIKQNCFIRNSRKKLKEDGINLKCNWCTLHTKQRTKSLKKSKPKLVTSTSFYLDFAFKHTVESGEIWIEFEVGPFCKPSCAPKGLTKEHVWGTISYTLIQRLCSKKKNRKFILLFDTVGKTLQLVQNGLNCDSMCLS